MSNYSRGAARERQAVELFTSRGWFAVRAAGSHGPADVVALKAGHQPLLVQVKMTAGSVYAGFGPADREELKAAAHRAGGRALLLHWPPNGPRRFIFEEGWPQPRRGR